jgi:hypothetical protein
LCDVLGNGLGNDWIGHEVRIAEGVNIALRAAGIGGHIHQAEAL